MSSHPDKGAAATQLAWRELRHAADSLQLLRRDVHAIAAVVVASVEVVDHRAGRLEEHLAAAHAVLSRIATTGPEDEEDDR